MRKHRFGRKIAAIAMAAAMTVSAAFSGGIGGTPIVHAAEPGVVPEVLDSASTVNYAAILGRATDFGIVAQNFHQNNHMETTFAINNFYNPTSIPNEVDFPLNDFTAQFVVGNINEGKFHLGGNETAKVYNIETSEAAANGFTYPWLDENNNLAYTGVKGNFQIDHNFYQNGKVLNVIVRENIDQNIGKMISDVKKKSDTINTKANDPKYVYKIPDSDYWADNAVTIDLTDAKFKGKVVYINVDSKLASRFDKPNGNGGQGQGVHIKKDPSTVVVFNFAENLSDVLGLNDDSTEASTSSKGVKISKFEVSTDGGATWVDTDSNNSMSEDLLKKKDAINQTVIFNVVADGPVELNTCGGAVLVPGSNKVNISGSSMGWLVSGGTAANNHAEWHYLYRGGNQEYSSDGSGQIHFAAKKAITDSYNGANTVSDDTFEIGANAYSFNWYETDKDYNITGVTPQVVSNQSTSTIKFPELSFFGSDPVKEVTYVTETKTVVFNTVGKDSHDNDAIEINETEFISQINSKVDGLKIIINYDGVVEGSKDIGFDGTAGDWNTYLDGGVIEAHSGAGKTVEVSGEDILKILNADTISKFRIRGYNGVKLNSVTAQYPVTKVQYKERNLTKEEKDYYVEDGKSKDFYYYIDEVGAGTVDAQGVEISKGYIKIHLQVTNNGGDLSYAVDSTTILGNGETYFTNGSFGNESIVNMSGVEFGLLEFFNKINGIEIDKVAVAGGPEIAGAKLTITALGNGTLFSMYPFKKGEITATRSSDTTVIDVTNSLEFNNKRLGADSYNSISFVTEKDMHTVLKGLPNGNYSLTETVVPENYAQAETITFTVKDGVVTSGGEGNVITMIDKISVNISKLDSDNNGVEGAKLEIHDANGKIVGEALEGFNNKSVQNVSLNPGTYTLVETTTPAKYRTADPIEFTVKEDGTIERSDNETVARNINSVDYNNIIVMINEEKKNELVITKTIDGANVTADDLENLKFTVQNDAGEFLYKDDKGTVQYSKDKVEIALKEFSKDSDSNVYTYKFENISTGDYTVSETQANIPGYNIEYVKINDTAITKDTDNAYVSAVVLSADGSTVKIEDSYTPIVGDLEITKTIDGKNVTEDDLKNLKFTVQNNAGEFLYKDDKGNVKTSKDKVEIALESFDHDSDKDVYTYKFDDIPVGNYTVKETQANIAGYDIEYVKINDSTVTAGTDNSYASDVVLTKDGKTVKIEDKYNQIVGDLEITKTIDGKNVTSDDLENLKFTVQNDAGEFLYKDNKGNVQTSKDTVTIALNSFEYDSNNNVYKYKFDDIPIGNYTVKETQANIAGYEIEYVKINDSTVTAGTDKAYTSDVVLTKDGKTVKIEDKYNQIVGDLEITKTIDGKNVTSDDLENLKFTVQNDAGEFLYKDNKGNVQTSKDTVTIALNSFEYDSNNNVYKYKFDDIPIGNYTVKETQANIAGYEFEYVKINDSTVTAGTDKAYTSDVVLTKDGKTVKIEDKYTQNAGNLEFIKTVIGGVTKEEADGALTFQVTTGTGSDKKYLTADGKLTTTETTLKVTDKCFTATTDTDGNVIYKATFAGIEVGQYSIVEKNTAIKAADGSNYTYTFVEDKSVTSGTAKVEKGKTATVSDLKDVYEKKTNAGNLEFIKTVTGGVTKEEADGALTFQVTTGTGSDKKYLTADGTLTTTETTLKVTDDCFSETTDTDGNLIYTATFTGLDLGEYVVTETNTAIKADDGSNYTYTFEDKQSVTGTTVTVENGKTATAELSDVYTKVEKTGSLVITKSFAKDCITEAEKEGGLQFTVTTKIGEDTFYLTSDGKLTDTKTIFTLNPDFTYDSDSNSWSKKFENVPIGTYTVEEVNTEVEGYKFKGSTYNGAAGTKGEITVEADEEAVENIVDEYEKVASLTVKKAVVDSEAATAASNKTFKIALKDADGNFYNGTEFTTSAKYYDVKAAGSVTFKDLPVDKTYTIVEDFGENNAKVNITGFTFNGFTAAPVELTQDATVTVTNDYTRDKGNLVITKLVKGPVTEDEFNGALTFSITDKNGQPISVTKNDGTTGTSENMTIKDYFKPVSSGKNEFKYELVIENVPTDTYTVTETNSTFDGYELVSKTGGGETSVVKGKDAVTDFVDEYKPVTGSLEIVKNFKDAPSNLDASKIVFKVSGPKLFNNGEDLTVTYDKFTSGKYVIDNAPIGEYTVTETSYEDSKIDGNYKYTFSTGASTVTGKTTVIKDTKATVTLLNVYDKEEILGSLTISKTVAMNDGSEVPADTFVSDKTFRVSVQNTDTGLYVSTETGKYSEQPVWFDIKAGSPVVIKNIKLGNYTVSEDVADATAVDYRIIYVGSASVSEGTATLTTDARDGSVALSNVYKHYEKEDIIDYPVFFSKEDSLSGAEVAGATIELYKGDKAEGTPVSTWISTLTSHVENLEPGTYTFKETVAPKGYDIVETAITFTVDKDDSEKGYSVKLIDLSDEVCYQRKDGTLVLKDDPMLGILKVVKVVETDTGNKPVVNGFNVTVKNLKNNKYVTSIDGTLGDEAADIFVPIDSTGVGSVEITGLRPAKYLVIEKEGDKALKGFIYDANGSIAELEEEITLTDKGASTAEIELANKYFENIGNLEITKKVTGDNPGKTDFEVTVTNEDGKFVTADGKLSDDKAVLTVKVGETLTIKNVPSGKYTVSEDLTDAADVTGFKFNSENSVSAKDATVTQGATAAVELINDYSEVPTGHLYVHVTEEKSGLDVPDATVTVTNKTTGETTEFKTNSKGEIVDDNGLTPELPVGDYTVVVSEVPEGYEVTTGESADITVPKNDTAKHEAVIKTVRGGIIITVYDEETGEVVSGAKVTITTPDGVTDTFVTNAKGQVDEYGKKDAFGNYTQVPGTFTYVVTEVPAGYKVTVGESQTGTVVADELTKLIAKIAPRTGGLDITVLDEKTEKAVPNAKVEVVTPDGTKYELITDKNGMITKFAEKDATGKYTAKVGEYKITVTTVPEGYTVTTGQTKSETVEEGKVKHHVAKIAPSKKITITDTKTDTTKTNTKTDTKKTDTNAKTGDATSVAGILAMMIMSLAAIGFIIRRKKEDEK